MKILEIIGDYIAATSIVEMAVERKAAKSIVTSMSPQIVKHLVKIYAFDNPNGNGHWIAEINAWLTVIDDIYLKHSKKKPSAEHLYQWFMEESGPHYDASWIYVTIAKMVKREYGNMPRSGMSSDEIMTKITNVIVSVLDDVASDDFVDIAEYI